MPLFRGLLFCVPTCFLEVICPRHSPDMSTIISTVNILIDSKIANKSIKNSKITKISSSNFSITKKKKKKAIFCSMFQYVYQCGCQVHIQLASMLSLHSFSTFIIFSIYSFEIFFWSSTLTFTSHFHRQDNYKTANSFLSILLWGNSKQVTTIMTPINLLHCLRSFLIKNKSHFIVGIPQYLGG